MGRLKHNFFKLVQAGVGAIPPNLIRRLTRQNLILPFYHIISDENMPHIEHLYPVKGVKAFIEDLDFLLKYYRPIDYFEFRKLVQSGAKPNKPSFLLSFDDGLSEFHNVVAPILIRKGVPTICFLNSAFIGNHDLFYRYKASLLIDQVKKYPDLGIKLSSLFRTKNIPKALLAITYKNQDILDEAARLIHYSFKDFLNDRKPYLSAGQISSLIEQGFHFGAHSIDHANYQQIPLQQQIRQTSESINSISQTFALDYKIFSFPFTDHGITREFFSYINLNRIADHTFGCAGQKKDTAPDHYQRMSFEVADLSGKKIHNAELLYYLLKIPFGKNIIERT